MKKKNPNILVVIPARGGSKGIPRKNLRSLAANPLISYSIQMALSSRYHPDVYVSSEDQEILTIAKKFGAKAHTRPLNLSSDITVLDPVVFDAYQTISISEKKAYSLIITLQPTSPLLRSSSLDAAIEKMMTDESIDTILSATDNTHLNWYLKGDKFVPNFNKRLNRQQLTPNYKETGGFLITRSNIISQNGRIGKKVELHLLKGAEKIDIDNYEDWNLCEYYLKRKTILFVVSGYTEIGLGHVYNTLSIADEILNHNLIFLVDDKSQLAFEKISNSNFPVFIQKRKNIVEDIEALNPHIIINDRLDTEKDYIIELKEKNYCVINFEDLGEGAQFADLVINAMYPEQSKIQNHYFGEKYFILRNEFQYSIQKAEIKPKVSKVLLSFGGVDPNNYTLKVVSSIMEYCNNNGIEIGIAAGIGYQKYRTIEAFHDVMIHRDSPELSDLIYEADIIFTSAGRTTFEISSIGTPAIVLSQNERESTHFFAHNEYGFINLGLGIQIKESQILTEFIKLAEDKELRNKKHRQLISNEIKSGKQRVVNKIYNVINNYKFKI